MDYVTTEFAEYGLKQHLSDKTNAEKHVLNRRTTVAQGEESEEYDIYNPYFNSEMRRRESRVLSKARPMAKSLFLERKTASTLRDNTSSNQSPEVSNKPDSIFTF